MLDVGGVFPPLEHVARGSGDVLPALVAFEHASVTRTEHVRVDVRGNQLLDFVAGGPDVRQEHLVSVRVSTQRLGGQVHVQAAGQGIGNHQRRRGQVVHLDVLVNASLEIAVARKHGTDDQVIFSDGIADGLGKWAGIPDAGGAAVADHVEAERLEIVHQARRVQVVRHHPRAGAERGLDPGLHAKAARHGVARQQARSEHDGGIRGIGAGGDRRDDHGAVLELKLPVPVIHGYGTGVPGLERCVVIAVVLLRAAEQDAVLGAFRAGHAGNDFRHVEFQHGGVFGLRRVGRQEHALGPGISLNQFDLRVGAAGQAQVAQAFVVDGEDAAGGAVFRRHVGDRGAVRQRQVRQAGAVELDELADHAVLPEHLHDGQHQVRGGGAFRQSAGQPETHDLRDQHGDRLAEHGGLGLDAADAPAEHADAVDHGRMRIGAHDRVRVGHHPAVHLAAENDTGKVFQVDLVDDARVGRNHGEVAERILPPAQETVAFLVAAELDDVVHLQRLAAAEPVHLYGVVDDKFGRG